jgi:hypothetical protein
VKKVSSDWLNLEVTMVTTKENFDWSKEGHVIATMKVGIGPVYWLSPVDTLARPGVQS